MEVCIEYVTKQETKFHSICTILLYIFLYTFPCRHFLSHLANYKSTDVES